LAASSPGCLTRFFKASRLGLDIGAQLIFGILAVITVVAIIYVYEGQRRIPIQISKQIRGNRIFRGGTTHIPLKVNSAGMIPLIFRLEHADPAWHGRQLLCGQQHRNCCNGCSISVIAQQEGEP
jgi:hypothetical protein